MGMKNMDKMSQDLLAKEKEFHRLNRELSEKTKDLMREVDSVLISHSTSLFGSRLNETSANLYYNLNESASSTELKKHLKQTNGKHEETPKPVRQCHERTGLENLTVEEIVSGEADNTKGEAIVRFLKAKIKLLHDELQTIRAEYKKKCNYCKELEMENKKLDDSKIKLHNQIISLKDAMAKLESNNGNIQTEIQNRAIENSSLKKEIDSLKKELKTVIQQTSNFDTRLNRSLEENERLRNIVKSHKMEERELREQIRKQQERERRSIKNLEKEKSEISQAFKKQTALVDNLKKQRACLIASKHVQMTEEEVSKILDWSPDNT